MLFRKDGSYKEGIGLSVWVLEGPSAASGRFTGYNLPPGITMGQNSHKVSWQGYME
jgi:hypothetical protein